jgi:hypothetical protein
MIARTPSVVLCVDCFNGFTPLTFIPVERREFVGDVFYMGQMGRLVYTDETRTTMILDRRR